MLKIELLKFEAQDVITASVATCNCNSVCEYLMDAEGNENGEVHHGCGGCAAADHPNASHG